MKVSLSRKGYTLSCISTCQLKTIMFLLEHIKERCFREGHDEEFNYYSGDGFSASLSKEEFYYFNDFVDGFWDEYKKLERKFIVK